MKERCATFANRSQVDTDRLNFVESSINRDLDERMLQFVVGRIRKEKKRENK